MAGMVSSAVVQETVNQIVSGMMDKYECKSNAKENMERLEMAHIKLEAALETSDKWKINDASALLRWQSKLKRAARECDETLRKCKQRILKEEEMEQEVKNSSFPKRIAHTTKSFISSFFNGSSNYESSRCVVRRFEWFADSASDFLRFLEHGGTPRQYLFFDPLVRHLLAGKTIVCKFARGNQHHLFFLRPFSTAEHGIEGSLLFIHKDGDAPENNFLLGLTLQLSESTDIVGIGIKCLELFYKPHFKSTAETVTMKLTQLPTQDLYCVDYNHKHHWNNIHGVLTQWFRPNPLCCKQHDQYKQQPCGSSNTNIPSELLPRISLQPVIKVYLQGYIPLPASCNRRRTIIKGKTSSLQNGFPYLKLGLHISPHASSEDLQPSFGGSVAEMIDGGEQHGLCTDITLEQLDEIMLPKAIDCLRRNAGATAYQMLWKSRHGSAYLQVEKTTVRKLLRRLDEKVQRRLIVVTEFLNSWAAQAPARLQGSIMDWMSMIQKEKEKEMQNRTSDSRLCK